MFDLNLCRELLFDFGHGASVSHGVPVYPLQLKVVYGVIL